jgi:transposase
LNFVFFARRLAMRVELGCTKGELDCLIAKTKNASRRQRLRVIRWALAGLTADEVATQTKLCRRQVQNWVRRFNGQGLAGLEDRPGRGRPCPLSTEQQVQFKARLAACPTAKDEVCTLRGEDVQHILAQEFGVLRKLSSIYHLLHSLGYSSLVPRPRHAQADPGRQDLFKKANCRASSLPSAKRTRKSKSKSSSKMRRGSASKGR